MNDAPIAQNATAKVGKNGSLKIDVEDLVDDADCDTLTITVDNPIHGSLKKNKDNTYTYTPDKNYAGNDGFSYTVSDGKIAATAKISIVVTNNGSSSITVNSILPPSTPALPQLKNNLSFAVVNNASAIDKTEMPTPLIDWSGASGLCSTTTYEVSAEDGWMLDFMGIKKEEEKQDLASLTGLKIVLKDQS